MSVIDERIIGYEEEKKILKRLSSILRKHEELERDGISLPKGLLLSGLPGVGKSTMAEAFAEETGWRKTVFHNIDSSFNEALNRAFEAAKGKQPSIIILEDMHQYAEYPRSTEWSAVQAQIDNVKNEKVFVIATINNNDNIPESLLRVGRFDYDLEIKAPTGDTAEQIVKSYLKNTPIADDIVFSDISEALTGHSTSTLEVLANTANRNRIVRGSNVIEKNDFIEALHHIVYKSKPCSIDDPDNFQVSLHEAGHVVVSEILCPDSVAFVTLCSNDSGQKGFTIYKGDDGVSTLDEIQSKAAISLAGKAAVELNIGFDVGAVNDIERAERQLNVALSQMASNGFKHSASVRSTSERLYDENEVVMAAKLEDAYRIARTVIIENRNFLDAVQKAILEKKSLLASEIQQIKKEVYAEQGRY